MALSKTFAGSVYDEAGNAIDCTIKGYHKEQQVWSSVYNSDSQYYSLDLGDSGWLTQDGSTGNTDNIVLVFETDEADPLDRRFAIYEFQMDGSDTYAQDVQLRPCMAPLVTGLWDLSSSVDGISTFVNADDNNTVTYIGRINDTITAIEQFTDEKSYTYNGVTLWHKIYVDGTDVFSDRVGISAIDYDWTEDDVFITDTTHSYTAISQIDLDKSQEVEAKVTNLKGIIVNDILKLQIRYNSPIPDITYTPITPSILDTFVVTGAVADVDSRVTSISWQYDGTEVNNNTTLDYQWTQDLGALYTPAGHTLNADTTWDDGFNSFTIVHQEHFDMTNLAPSFTLTKTVIGATEDNDVKFSLSALHDPDGDDALLEARWVIEYKVPFSNEMTTVYSSGYPDTIDITDKEWIFDTGGEYRVTAYVKDQYGLETTQFIDLSFTSGSKCEGAGKIRLNTSDTAGDARWQLISIPVKNQNVKAYFLDRLETIIKTYDDTKTINDVVERVSAYPGNLGRFLTFIPGVTPITSEGNFSLVMEDGTNVYEILGFWVKIKDYKSITNGDDIIYEWDMTDG